VYIGSDRNFQDFRFPVQMVNRPHLDFRGFCGTIASGIVRKGDEIMALPSRKTSKVKSIVTFDGELEEAFTPSSVTLTLEDEIDISRGDVIVRAGNLPRVDNRFEAMIVWMDEEAMTPGKTYIFKHSSTEVNGVINTLRYLVDVNTLHRQDAPTLTLNDIGRCAITLNAPICYDGYRRNRATGAFIIVDRMTNSTVGAGMIRDTNTSDRDTPVWDVQPQSEHLHNEQSNVTLDERSARFGQKPVTLLLTGLPGAGKTTTAYALERRLFSDGRAAMVLDGQNMRLGISKDLGFTATDRSENLRRSAEVARIMNDAGLICIAAFVAPSEEIRQRAAEVAGEGRFLVVHLSAPVEICRERDTEGLYGAADAGEIANFPGVTYEYETPENADLTLPTHEIDTAGCIERIMKLLNSRGVIV